MTTVIHRIILMLLIPLLLASIATNVNATGTKSVALELHLVVTQPPPCTIDNTPIRMPDVHQNEANGSYRDFFVTIECSDSDGHDLILRVQGTPTAYSDAILQTSTPNLGIGLVDENKNPIIVSGAGTAISVPIDPGLWTAMVPIRVILLTENTSEPPAVGYYMAIASLTLEYP